LLTVARDLRRRKARERVDRFVAEGIRAVEELLKSPIGVEGALIAPRLADTPRGRALRAAIGDRKIVVQEVTDDEFASAADTENPQGILAIAVIPDRTLAAVASHGPARILVLDAVQDPGNVGTLVRTAAALGATATLALPGTVDLWNAKVVRSAMGAHFHHSCLTGSWDDLRMLGAETALTVWGADAAGEPLDGLEPPERLALVVGNEGGGLSSESRSRADRLIALPVTSAVESLNVAVAGAIALYERSRLTSDTNA